MTKLIEVENKMAALETKAKGIVDTHVLGSVSEHLYDGVTAIIDNARTQVAIYVNAHASMTFWSVSKYIIDDMDYQTYSAYGKKILATLSQTLSWSHFLELITIKDPTKRLFYQQVGMSEHWSVQQLRDKQWFLDKLNRSIMIAKEHGEREVRKDSF